MFDSVFSLRHSFACKVLKGDSFKSQSDNKERKKERKPVMQFIINDKETVSRETFCLRKRKQQLILNTLNCIGRNSGFCAKFSFSETK